MKHKKDNGIALITVLMLTVLLIMMTVSMVFISTNHLNMIGNIEEKMMALKASEAAAEYALSKLNIDPVWGINPLPKDNITINLNGATASINFTGTEYLSYNNLKGQSPMERTGDSKLTGSVPAYTAEIICKGVSGRATKYLKVLFVRNDIYPYPINSEGKILFNAGNVNIFGATTDIPGCIHSNWDGSSYPQEDPEHWSIKRDKGTLNAKGGIASAVGDIDLPDAADPNIIIKRPNLGPDGRLNLEDIDPAKIVDDHNSCKKVEPATYLFTDLYYIPDDQAKMAQILNNVFTGEQKQNMAATSGDIPSTPESAAAKYGVNISGWENLSLTQNCTDLTFTDVEGVTKDLRKDLDPPPAKLGWDEIKGKSGTITMNWSISGMKPRYDDPNNPGTVTGYDPVSLTGTTDLQNAAINSNEADYKVSPYNWAGSSDSKHPLPSEQASARPYLENDFGFGKISTGRVMSAFLPPGYNDDKLGMEINVDKSDFSMSANIKLKEDIYIGPSAPSPEDYKLGLDEIGNMEEPRTNLFRLKKDTLYIQKPGGGLTEYPLDITLDLNNHNIYSDGHVMIEAEVTGKGALVTKGKLAYLHGLRSDEIVSLAGDDLTLQLSGTAPYYDINGYLYSRDDTQIVPWDIGPLDTPGGFAQAKYPLNKDFTDGAGNTLIFTVSSQGGYVPMFRNAGTYIIPHGVKLKYNGTSYDFSDYSIQIEAGVTKLYDVSGTEVSPSPFPQNLLDSIGTIIVFNYDKVKDKPVVTITGTVIGMNSHKAEDGDYAGIYSPLENHGNDSIHIYGEKMSEVVFKYNSTGLGRITDLRGDDFHVRIASWIEL